MLSIKSKIDRYDGDLGQVVEHLGGGHHDDHQRAAHSHDQDKAVERNVGK